MTLGRRPIDRGTVLAGIGLVAVAASAWVVLVSGWAAKPATGEMDDPMYAASMLAAAGFIVAWIVMMTAMMLPSAGPMLALYRAVLVERRAADEPGALWAVATGYLLVWATIGALVYAAGIALTMLAARQPPVAELLRLATPAVFVAAGLYQFTPIKQACLQQCRSPFGFLLQHWGGVRRAFHLGIAHGTYCVGCCWGLMAVLVVAGAMHIAWVATIALVVFLEKVLPGAWLRGLVGAGLLSCGAVAAALAG